MAYLAAQELARRMSLWISRIIATALAVYLSATCALAAKKQAPGEQGERYHNPILYADYSDPDIIRDGSNYYLIASTFHFVPGIPILQSQDLVHWTILGHVVQRLTMDRRYSMESGASYGNGVWAPAIRKHNGLFYVYFPTPTEGIFMSTASKIAGPWTAPIAVIAQPGLEDPCPFWDEDGKAYLVHSRKGAGPLILHRMSADGKRILDEGKVIVEDREHLPTLEGPKLYKRHGWYYIFAPFGGVFSGEQVVLRSRTIDGPYEHRVVLTKGSTPINGPHQGGYVESPDGQGWFVHFQAGGAHGRIVALEPVTWHDDWPVIGQPLPSKTEGQPVEFGLVPNAPGAANQRPQTSDEFSSPTLGPQWEWNHNPEDARWSLSARKGFLRLLPGHADTLLDARNTLTQCMQDHSFDFTTRIDLANLKAGGHAGLTMFEKSASGIEVVQTGSERRLQYFSPTDHVPGPLLTQPSVDLRVQVNGDQAMYFYSVDDGGSFVPLGAETAIHFSWWKGSRPALFAYTTSSGDPGAVDFDWAHYHPVGQNPW